MCQMQEIEGARKASFFIEGPESCQSSSCGLLIFYVLEELY